MVESKTTDPYDQIKRKWKWIENYPKGIQIHTADDGGHPFRIFSMFHSGFGVSTNDREMAQHICDLHNASLK